jgi:bacterioferritin-associated ferredoxin
MLQWILTIIIVLAATAYAIYKIIRRFKTPARKKDPDCSGCSSDCGDCPLAAEILKKKNLSGQNQRSGAKPTQS